MDPINPYSFLLGITQTEKEPATKSGQAEAKAKRIWATLDSLLACGKQHKPLKAEMYKRAATIALTAAAHFNDAAVFAEEELTANVDARVRAPRKKVRA